MKAYEEKVFESALDKVKKTVQIIERNFQKTFRHHT